MPTAIDEPRQQVESDEDLYRVHPNRRRRQARYARAPRANEFKTVAPEAAVTAPRPSPRVRPRARRAHPPLHFTWIGSLSAFLLGAQLLLVLYLSTFELYARNNVMSLDKQIQAANLDINRTQAVISSYDKLPNIERWASDGGMRRVNQGDFDDFADKSRWTPSAAATALDANPLPNSYSTPVPAAKATQPHHAVSAAAPEAGQRQNATGGTNAGDRPVENDSGEPVAGGTDAETGAGTAPATGPKSETAPKNEAGVGADAVAGGSTETAPDATMGTDGAVGADGTGPAVNAQALDGDGISVRPVHHHRRHSVPTATEP